MLVLLDPLDDQEPFPEVTQALEEPNGLLAVGGSLSPPRLIAAYRQGIFPWYNEGEPILWWSPDPRLVLFPKKLRVSRSLRKIIRRKEFSITFDQAFRQVIAGCAAPRPSAEGTWITRQMISAYCELHRMGLAHSVEAWKRGRLVGGLYGVALGRVFFGESMFTRQSNASKVAFATLVQTLTGWNYTLLDCQVYTHHLASLGAEEIPRNTFVRLLGRYGDQPPEDEAWKKEP